MIENDVTILIAVYNEINFIEKAILSVVEQAQTIIISDNNSTDGTKIICKKLANQYTNIKLFEQQENIGSLKNSEFLFSQIKTKYFTHLGGHDYLSKNYIEKLLLAHENDPSLAIAYAPYTDVDINNRITAEHSLTTHEEKFSSSDRDKRVLASIIYPENVFMIFGLYKTNLAIKHWDFSCEAGVDRLILSNFAFAGKLKRVESTTFYRRILDRDESTQAYMKRIQGNKYNKSNRSNYDLNYMCTNQIKLLENTIANHSESSHYLQIAEEFFEKTCYREYDKYKDKAAKEYTFLKNLSNNKEKFILYGAGMESDYIINIMHSSLSFIVDINPIKENKNKNGIIIKSPLELMTTNNKIIISHIPKYKQIFNYITNELKIDSSRIIRLPSQNV